MLGAYAVYNLAMVKKPWTLGTTYMSTLNYSADKPSIMSVKVNSNKNNNGQNIYDLKLSAYNDTDGKSTSAYGIQCVGDWSYRNAAGYGNAVFVDLPGLFKFNSSSKMINSTYVRGNFYFYKTDDNGLTYYRIDYKDIPNELLIDINGSFYSIKLKDYTYTTEHEYSAWKFWRWGQTYTKEHTSQFTWIEIFDKIMQSATNDSGESEFSKFGLNFFDLKDFVEIYEQNDKGQYNALPDTTENKTLLSIPVEFTKDGATESSDSMFKMVGYSTTWSHWNDTSVSDYWGVSTPNTVTEKELNYIHYSAYDGYYLTLDARFENFLKTAKTDEINVVIDLSKKSEYPIKGIDLKHFGFKINSFTILNAGEDFEILNQDSCKIVPTIVKAEV